MKAFVASSSKHHSRHIAKEAMTLLEAWKCVNTCDWTKDWDEHIEQGYNPSECAERDLKGVKEADVLIYLWTPEMTHGAPVELGYAKGYTDAVEDMLHVLWQFQPGLEVQVSALPNFPVRKKIWVLIPIEYQDKFDEKLWPVPNNKIYLHQPEIEVVYGLRNLARRLQLEATEMNYQDRVSYGKGNELAKWLTYGKGKNK